jgi:hypothetical protein
MGTTIIVVRQIGLLILLIAISGCSSFHSISKEDQPSDNTNTLRVILNDDREITFKPNAYTIHRDLDSSYIRGIGTESGGSGGREANYDGQIFYRDIKELQVSGSSTFNQVSTPIGISLLVVVVLGMVAIASAGNWN